jgi:hypothetical protein
MIYVKVRKNVGSYLINQKKIYTHAHVHLAENTHTHTHTHIYIYKIEHTFVLIFDDS